MFLRRSTLLLHKSGKRYLLRQLSSKGSSSSSSGHDIYSNGQSEKLVNDEEESSQIKHILMDNASRLWPEDNPALKARVALAVSLLIGAKVANVQVPFIFKSLVDSLNVPTEQLLTVAAPLGLVVGYGVARSTASLFQELRSAVFAKVVQTAIRDVARESFLKLHSLDLSFHLQRQTGKLFRVIDRGSRSIDYVMRSMLFNIVPTSLEILLVSGIMTVQCGPSYAAVTLGTWCSSVGVGVRAREFNVRAVKRSNRIMRITFKSQECHFIYIT